jgi:hypothetical protein
MHQVAIGLEALLAELKKAARFINVAKADKRPECECAITRPAIGVSVA